MFKGSKLASVCSVCVITMDVSPVQSGSKCGSDFSIERILSEDSRKRKDNVETPSWLWCTRYQPPRISRPVNSNASRARRSGRHARVPFTAAQASALEAAYSRAPYLAPPALRALASALQLRDDRIKIWFQNRRARERKEKCAAVPPPQAITLLPTTMTLPPGVVSSTWTLHNVPSSAAVNCSTIELPKDLSSSKTSSLTQYCSNSAYSDESEDRFDLQRPDTPLDIETIEDN